MTTLLDVERHRDVCNACSPSVLCSRGAVLLQRATDEIAGRLVPDLPVEVIDLPSHIAGCASCRGNRLCTEGRRLADLQSTMLLEIGARRMGRA